MAKSYRDTVPLETIFARIDAQVDSVGDGATIAAASFAQELEDFAKQNHPWQNRTHDTEDTTVVLPDRPSQDKITLKLTTGTYYSRFLELAHGGKWAWLWPAVLATRGRLMYWLKTGGL